MYTELDVLLSILYRAQRVKMSATKKSAKRTPARAAVQEEPPKPPVESTKSLRNNIDRSIMEAFGDENIDDDDGLPTVDAQRHSLATNTGRLDEASVIDIYRIPYWQGCKHLFIGQRPGVLAIDLRRIPDDIITMMYLQLNIFLDQRKTQIT